MQKISGLTMEEEKNDFLLRNPNINKTNLGLLIFSVVLFSTIWKVDWLNPVDTKCSISHRDIKFSGPPLLYWEHIRHAGYGREHFLCYMNDSVLACL